ncbi:MAG: FtsB family cell division protein [Pseudonocardiaceae bacterium]
MTASLAAPPHNTTSTVGLTPTRRRGAGPARTRSAAVARAYARRAQRNGALHSAGRTPTAAHRAPFVVLVMVLLSAALVATLWLSTAAAADSYRLQNARESARDLTERSEQLGREVATLETAPELARRALELGMVPAGDPARLVVGPGGAVTVIGEPKVATAPSAAIPAEVDPASAPPALSPQATVPGRT